MARGHRFNGDEDLRRVRRACRGGRWFRLASGGEQGERENREHANAHHHHGEGS